MEHRRLLRRTVSILRLAGRLATRPFPRSARLVLLALSGLLALSTPARARADTLTIAEAWLSPFSGQYALDPTSAAVSGLGSDAGATAAVGRLTAIAEAR